MTVNIILAAVIACLVTALIFTAKGNLRLQKEVEETNQQLHNTKYELTHLQAMYIEAVQTSAWLRGLHIMHGPKQMPQEKPVNRRNPARKEDKTE